MTEGSAGSVFLGGLHYGEGLRWRFGSLWVSDVLGNKVLQVNEDGTVCTVVDVEGPSGLGWLPDGRLVISALGRSSVAVVTDETASQLYDLSSFGWTTNDMLVDKRGRIYVDVYREFDETGMPIGDIVLVNDAGAQVVVRDIRTPNGIALSSDGTTLLLSETFSGSIYAFTVNDDGTLHDQRMFAHLGPARRPDGLCLDEEGAVWVGSFKTEEFLRVREGGEITHRIETPGFAAVAPALGGSDGKTLFLALNDHSALDGALSQGLSREPRSRVECIRVDVPGIGSP